MQNEAAVVAKWTQENIIDLIRKVRNDLIKDFLDERFLLDYLYREFKIRELSHVRLEFIRTALKDLLIAPVNTAHYRLIIDQISQTDTASLSEGNEKLFYEEIERILKTYLY